MCFLPRGRARWLAYAAVLGAAFPAGVARAQSLSDGTIRGQVLMAAGAPIPSVALTLEDESGVRIRVFRSNYTGSFLVPAVPPGLYRILAEREGFQPVRTFGIQLVGGLITDLRLRMTRRPPPIISIEEVRVPEQRLIAPGPGVAQTVGREALEWNAPRLAVTEVSRGTDQAAAPIGVRWGFADMVSGLPQTQSRLMVDGLPGSWLRHPGLDAEPAGTPVYPRYLMSQATVDPNVSDVEWPGGAGATLGVVSRRGTAKFRFEPFVAWSGKPGVPKALNPADSSLTSVRAGGTLAGTLVPDRATFLAGGAYEELETPTARPWARDSAGFGGAAVPLGATIAAIASDSFGQGLGGQVAPVVRSWRGGSAGGRIDLRASDVHTLVFRAGFARWRERSPEFGVDVLNNSAGRLEARDFSGGAAWLASLNGGASNEFRAGYRVTRRDWSQETIPGTYFIAEGAGIGDAPAWPGNFKQTSFDFSEAISFDIARKHRTKFALTASFLRWEQDYFYGRSGSFQFGDLDQFGSGTGTFTQAVAPPGTANIKYSEYGVAWQTNFQLGPAFTLFTGVRYDRQKFPPARKTRIINQSAVFAQSFGRSNARVPDDNNNLGPRIGLHWEAGPDRQWQLSLAASREYGQLNLAALSEAVVGDGPLTVRRGLGTFAWPALPDTVAAPTVGARFTMFSDKDQYKNPRAAKFDLRVERVLPLGVTVSAVGRYHHVDFLLRRTDLNLVGSPSGTTQEGRGVYGALVQQGGLLTVQPGSNRRFGAFELVSALQSTGFSNYYEVGLAARREASRGLSFSAAYTLSRTRDNWLQSPNGDPYDALSPFPSQRPGNEWAEGVSDFDIPHRVSLLATWRWGARTPVAVGARYRFRSGLPYTPGFQPGVDANGDGSGGNDPAFVSPAISGLGAVIDGHACLKDQVGQFAARNSCRAGGHHALDVNAVVGLPVHSLGGQVELTLDLFNLVNSASGIVDRALVLVDPAGSTTTDQQGNVSIPLIANPRFGSLLSRRGEPRMLWVGLRLGY